MTPQPVFPTLIIAVLCFISSTVFAQPDVNSIYPASQRVHDYIELQGDDFGTSQGNSRVLYTDGTTTIEAGKAYVWRDNFIRIRVPVGNRIGGVNTPIPKTPMLIFVQTAAGNSNMQPFQVITANTGTLSFRELTDVVANSDASNVLGIPNLNQARTKDADLGDVNQDGFLDILDNNSNNIDNSSHSIIRLNNQDKSFTSMRLEPLEDGEPGTFATTVLAGGDYFGNNTSYDSDLVDIDNDRYPDLIQTAANNFGGFAEDSRIRILMNNHGGNPGRFLEDTEARLPAGAMGTDGCPDDFDHGDINNDGNLDFLVTMRTAPVFCDGSTSNTRIFINSGGGSFGSPIVLDAPTNISTHDGFFIDANADGFEDVILCNEWNNDGGGTAGVQSQLFTHNGSTGSPGYTQTSLFNFPAAAGDAADLNGDGFLDIVLARENVGVFLNDPASPGNFGAADVLTSSAVNPPFYDIEFGDLDLDGWVDIIGATLSSDEEINVRIWLNDGDGTFTELSPSNATGILPGNGGFQRLSADLLDFDLDGDLDLYITGADATDSGVGDGGFGRAPNQFFENLLASLNIVTPLQSIPAYGGSSTSGRKVLVRLRQNTPFAGITLADFQVEVDGAAIPPDDIVTGAQIEEEFWLLVQMPAKTDGCYDLRVSLISDPDMSDTEPQSICFDDDRLFDRALAIDRTNSMNYDASIDGFTGEKMIAARAAANFFLDLSVENDKIGVTSFQVESSGSPVSQAELAETDFSMVPSVNGGTDNRALARDIVNGLSPTPYDPPIRETSIGAGLQEAFNMLNDPGQGNPDHEWEIVLVSDGLENYGPYWDQDGSGGPLKPILQAASPHVTVHSIALGPDADVEVLLDIANTTGGTFFNLYEGTGSFGLTSRLAKTYKQIDEEMRDEQRFLYREGLPPLTMAGNPSSIKKIKDLRVDSFYVDNTFESISVGFHANLPNVTAAIMIFPDGGSIPHSPPATSIVSDNRHRVYRISSPPVGWYKYAVQTTSFIPADLEFFVVASGITSLVAKAFAGDFNTISPGNYRVPIRLVVGDFGPVLNASVDGIVSLPDKSKIPITLFDDGAHEDGGAGDGIYGNYFQHSMPGGHLAELTVDGISNLNQPFLREKSVSFVFPGLPKDPDATDLPPGTRVPTGKGSFMLGFRVGSAHPLGNFNDGHDANIHFRLDASYQLNQRWAILGNFGFSQFTRENTSSAAHQHWTNLSVNAKFGTPMANGFVPFVEFGPGIYIPKTGSNRAGINVGLGGQIPLSGPFFIDFGLDYHRILSDNGPNFLTAQIGVLWSWQRTFNFKNSKLTLPSKRISIQ